MRGMAAAAAAALVVGVLGSADAARLRGTASVIDGDTLEIRGERVRMAGIDAPESSQLCYGRSGKAWRCGQRAAMALDQHIGRASVRCEASERDRYDRLIATCYRGSEDLNAWMVASGNAVAYRRYSRAYIREEQAAKARDMGIWGSRFVMPWDWRRGARLDGAEVSSQARGRDRDCGDFRSHREAQAFFEASGPGDPHRLDRDGNGRACESLR